MSADIEDIIFPKDGAEWFGNECVDTLGDCVSHSNDSDDSYFLTCDCMQSGKLLPAFQGATCSLILQCTLKVEVAGSSERWVLIYHTTWGSHLKRTIIFK
jgi:hypothetical protein